MPEQRITSAPAEALVTASSVPARVTSAPLEALITASSVPARVTSAPLEALIAQGPPVWLDVYAPGAAGSASLAFKARLQRVWDVGIRIELDGPGSGTFAIHRSDEQATPDILGDGAEDARYVKVTIPEISGDPIFGFWLEEGDFALLSSSEEGGEVLRFSGRGSLAYLDFARMAHTSYISGGMDPYEGLWRLYAAGTGTKPGQLLRRVIAEITEPSRPQKPCPLLTVDFDYSVDSTGATWASSDATAEMTAQIGESVLDVVLRLVATGVLTVQMTPDLLLRGFNSYGTDRTSTTYATGKVRFVGGDNIGSPRAADLVRQVRRGRNPTHLWVYGDSEAKTVVGSSDAASRVTREGYLGTRSTGATTLTAEGQAALAELAKRAEAVTVPIVPGWSELTGRYMPGPSGSRGHFWVGDTVTLHTGTDAWDFNNQAFRIAAINIELPDDAIVASDLLVTVELGSVAIADDAVGSSPSVVVPSGVTGSVAPHSHPAPTTTWLAPCRVATTGNVNLASGLAAGSVIDGVTLVAGDRVLVRAQTAAAENGIYVAPSSGAANRAGDADTGAKLAGAAVVVREGTTYGDTAWMVATDGTITVGTTAITWQALVSFPGSGTTSSAPGDTTSDGTSSAYSSADHRHGREGYATTAEIADVAGTESAGESATVARGDHVHRLGIATTKGDLLVSDGTQVTRLPVGADGQVLTADAAQALGVKWAAGGGGGAGGWTRVQRVVLTSDQASVTISGLNGDADHLYAIYVRFRRGASGPDAISLWCRPNGDTTSGNYGYQFVAGSGTTASAGGTTDAPGLWLGVVTSANPTSFGQAILDAATGAVRILSCTAADRVIGTTITRRIEISSVWNNTADNITSLVFAPDSGVIGSGTVIDVWKSG